MLRQKGLTDKIILLGIDGMDPRFSRKMLNEGKLPYLEGVSTSFSGQLRAGLNYQ